MKLSTINQIIANRRNAARTRSVREMLRPGDKIRVLRPSDKQASPALVTETRTYFYGQKEAYCVAEDFSFSGWVSIEYILPDFEVRN